MFVTVAVDVWVGVLDGVGVGVLVGVSVVVAVALSVRTVVSVGVGSGAASASPPIRNPKAPPTRNKPVANTAMSQRGMSRIYAAEVDSATRMLG